MPCLPVEHIEEFKVFNLGKHIAYACQNNCQIKLLSFQRDNPFLVYLKDQAELTVPILVSSELWQGAGCSRSLFPRWQGAFLSGAQ